MFGRGPLVDRLLGRNQRGSQTVEWLALSLVVLALLGLFAQAVRNHGTLPSKFTAAVSRLIEQAVPKD
ncbi:MAG: hypothetical protein DIU70_005970 [Bacillota bacterium]|nr:MAG: hypothetical protein DIU70_08070 [Bacillota bacterium]